MAFSVLFINRIYDGYLSEHTLPLKNNKYSFVLKFKYVETVRLFSFGNLRQYY